MQKTTNETPATEDEAPWRRNNVTRVRSTNESPIKNRMYFVIFVFYLIKFNDLLPYFVGIIYLLEVPDNEVSSKTNNTTETDVILRRTQSFENDEK